MKSLFGETLLVLGYARSGQAAAELAAGQGATVRVADRKVVSCPFPTWLDHDLSALDGVDRVVVSPGVSARQVLRVEAAARGIPVVSELAFARQFLSQRMVAITGTNGKSTVTHLTGALLAAAGFRCFVGGNLGTPLAKAVGDPRTELLVVEVSSYQLETSQGLRSDVGMILNLTPDHLERHGSMEGYARAKASLFDACLPSDFALLPAGDELLHRSVRTEAKRLTLGRHPGVVREGRTCFLAGPTELTFDLGPVRLVGDHNLDNVCAALQAASLLGAAPASLQEALGSLEPLAHRLQVVREEPNLRWINDSKATNLDSVRVALRSLDRPTVLLLGGQAKGPGFHSLADALRPWVVAVLTFGGSGEAIAQELASEGAQYVGTLADAVALSRHLAPREGQIVLSPGCASFDAFRDFEHRGAVFTELAFGA